MASGLRHVMPFLILELALVFVSSLTGQVRSLSDRVLQSHRTNHINGMIIRKAISLTCNSSKTRSSMTPSRTPGVRRIPARSPS